MAAIDSDESVTVRTFPRKAAAAQTHVVTIVATRCPRLGASNLHFLALEQRMCLLKEHVAKTGDWPLTEVFSMHQIRVRTARTLRMFARRRCTLISRKSADSSFCYGHCPQMP